MNKNMKKDDYSSFQTVWKVARGSARALPALALAHLDSALTGDKIAFRTNGSFTVNWGDGCTERVYGAMHGANFLKHKYVKPGEYTVSISSGIKYFSVSNGSNKELIEIKQWGRAQWKRMNEMFFRAENMICTATDTPDLSKVLDMSRMFHDCKKFNSPIEHWDTKGVKYMNHMLHGARMFNRSLAKMDLKAIEDVDLMLAETPAFNQDLRDLNIRAKVDTDDLFGRDGWDKSLAEHNEKYEVDEQRQDVYSVLKT